MKKKLTLTIDESVIIAAKRLAKKAGMSLSQIVEDYLRDTSAKERGWQHEEGSWTDQLLGSVHLSNEMEDVDYKKIKEHEILSKYGE